MAGSESKNKKEITLKDLQGDSVSNLKAFFNTIDHLLAVIDLNGCFIDLNRAGLDLLGYSAAELLGKDAAIVFNEKDHKGITDKFDKIRERGEGELTYSLCTKSGSQISTILSFHKGVWDKQDAFFVVGKNVSTDNILAEARNISLKIASADSRGDLKTISEMALVETIRLTGSSLGFFGEYDSKSGGMKTPILISNSKSVPFESLPGSALMQHSGLWTKAINDKQPIVLTGSHITQMEEGLFALENGIIMPLVEKDQVNYIVGLGNKRGDYNDLDINLISILWDNVISKIKRVRVQIDLRESEFEYKNLFDSSRDGLLLYDLTTFSIVLCNSAAVDMFGYKDHDDILKRTPLDLSADFQPDGSSSAEALARNPIRALHESIYIPKWLHKKKSGDEFISEVSLTSINYKGERIILANIRDISEKLKVESELKMSEESFSLAIQEGGLGTWDYDVETRVMDVGAGFNKIIGTGLTSRSFGIDKWLELIHPDDLPIISKSFRSHIAGESNAYRSEYRIRKKSGEYIWIQSSGRAVDRDEKGLALRLVGVILNIDSTKKLAREVEDARNFLQTIISSIEAILFVKDTDGKYLLANRSFMDKFDLQKRKVIGKTGAELNIPIDRDSSLYDEVVIKQGVEQTYEQEIKLKDGKVYNYLITKIPIKDKDEVVYAQVGLATDITHIKELEKDLRNNVFSLDAAVNGTGNGLWDWNPSTDELIVNDNWFTILGYNRSQFTKKYRSFGFQMFADLIHPEDIGNVNTELDKHYKGKSDYYSTEIRMLTADNQWKWILTSGKVWEWSEDRMPVRMVGIHIDIDYRVRVGEQLKQALIKAEESDRLKSAFLANMSHEIRTPMNGIIGFLDLLESVEITPDQRKEYITIIRNSSNQLLDIVNDIVDISKIEAGQVTIRESKVDLSKLFEDLKRQFRPELDKKGLLFKTSCKLAGERRIIVTDHTKVRQVISNLVSNAIKFTSEGSIQLSCEREGDFIKFCVEDTGMGIDPDLHHKVFERFVQVEMGLSRLQVGTGLGLPICKGYVEKLGGKIWIESRSGKGSKFCFTIPYNRSDDAPLKTERKMPVEENRSGLILVVEDEIYNYLFVEQILQNRGLRVMHAEDGQIALDMIDKNADIAMVFMDIRLPGIDGYETTRKIKKKFPDLPVIALTALALSGDHKKALEAGCDDYIKKPVLKEELLNAVRRILKD